MSNNEEQSEEQKYLGIGVGKNNEFLAYTSCMSFQRRRQLAQVRAYRRLVTLPANADFNAFLDKVGIPYLEEIGFSEWLRNELTDLSLRTALSKEKQAFDYEANK